MSFRSLLTALLGCAAVACGSAAAAQPTTSTRASLVALTEVADIESLALSPDGQKLAFRVQRPSIARNTYTITWYVADLASGTTTPVADGGEVIYDNGVIEADAPVWSSDNTAFFRRALVSGAIGIWRTGADGSGSTQVVAGDADVERIAAAPDHDALIYWTGPTRAAVDAAERAEYDEGILIDTTVDPRQGLFRPAYSHGRLATQRLTGYWHSRDQLLWRYPRARHHLDLTTLRSERAGEEPARSETGLGAVAVTEVKSATGAAAKIMAGSQLEPPRIEVRRADGTTVSCGDAICRSGSIAATVWRPGREQLLVTTRDFAFRQALHVFDPATGRLRTVTRGEGLLSGGRDWQAPCAVSARYAVCVDAAAASPPRLVRVDIDTGQRAVLLDPNRALRARPAPAVEDIDVSIGDGRVASAVLLSPRQRPGRLPLFLMYYHCPGYLRGGMGDEFPFGPLVEAGFAVACITYVPTKPDETAVDDYQHAQAVVENVVAQLDRRGLIDKTKIGMGGLSFGSEVTMWMAMRTDLLAAIATASPQPSPSNYWYVTMRGRNVADRYRIRWKAGPPDQDPDAWKLISPELNVDRIKAPLLMQLPEQEYTSSMPFYVRLGQTTTPVELVAYPHESHTKLQPRHRYAVYRRTLDWFRYWLQDYRDPDPAQEEQYRRWDELLARRGSSAK